MKNAYQLTLTVKDEDTNTPVASIILPFEFTQPTLDITRVNGEKAIWNDKKNVLSIYGDLVKEGDVEIMSVPSTKHLLLHMLNNILYLVLQLSTIL